jgi:hypothetical protein
MPAPVEAVDDQSAQVTLTKTVYTVFKAPYVAGSVHVYVNGMLQDESWVTEIDPAAGTIEVDQPVLLRAADDHSLHIAYLTFQPIYVDPEDPIHITELVQGDIVRIAMKAGRHLVPKFTARTRQVQLVPVAKKQRARNFARTEFYCHIMQNDRFTGTLYGQVERRGPPRHHAAATVPYKDIRVIERFITPGRPKIDPAVTGGGPGAARRPGVHAKGFLDPQGLRKLIRVKF